MIKAIGLDLGSKTLGVAYSDVLGIVHTVETFRFPFEKYESAVEEVMSLTKKYGTKNIALGYPLNMNGSESERSKKSLKFKDLLLEKDPTLNITMIDERLTTVQAHSYLNEMDVTSKKRKEVVDQLAAYEILSTYLRMKENNQI